MKRFLLYIFKILVIVFVIMYILDFAYSYTFQKGVPRNKIQKILQSEKTHYNFAFFGSSRTENHIDCELIEKLTGKSCVNLGISGASLGDMLILLALAESKGIAFDNVFIQLDYNFNHSGITNNFRASLVPFIKKPEIKKILQRDKDNFSYNYIPFYRYMKYDEVVGFREFISVFLNKKPKKDINVGFVPKTGIGFGVFGELPNQFNEKNSELDEIIKLSSNNGFKLGFFTAPYCKEIENRDKLEELKQRIPSILSYVSIFDDKPEYYFNCGHLNIEGAREFTRILIKDIYPSRADLSNEN